MADIARAGQYAGTPQTKANSADGVAFLNQLNAEPTSFPECVTEFLPLLKNDNTLAKQVFDQAPNLFLECVHGAIKERVISEILPPKFFFENEAEIRKAATEDACPLEFDDLLIGLTEQTNLLDHVSSQDFQSDLLELYIDLLLLDSPQDQTADPHPTEASESGKAVIADQAADGFVAFMAWCKEQLASRTQGEWKEAIERAIENMLGLFDLLDVVVGVDQSFRLGSNLQHALEEFGMQIMRDPKDIETDAIKALRNAVKTLALDSKSILCEQLFKEMHSINPTLSDSFFEIFHFAFDQVESKIDPDQFINDLARPIILQECRAGLAELVRLIEGKPALFEKAPEARKIDFVSIVNQKLHESEEDTEPQLKKLAALIGIEEQEVKKDSEETKEETNEEAG